jgi:hypothetical protein
MPRLIRTVPAAGATAVSTFQVMRGRKNQQAIFQIGVGLFWSGGFVVFIRAGLGHPESTCHFARTMMADPMKIKIPPTTTGGCSCPLNKST